MEITIYMLLKRLYFDYWTCIAAMSPAIVMIVVLTVHGIICFKKTPSLLRELGVFTIAIMLALCCLCGFIWSKRRMDDIYLKSNNPLVVEGTVIRFANNSESEGSYTRSNPVVRVDETGEEITMGIPYAAERVTIGQTYDFVYLPNSGLADIYESDSLVPMQTSMRKATCELLYIFYQEFFLSFAALCAMFLFALFIIADCIDHRKTMNKIFKAASIAVSAVLVVAICVGGVVVSKHPKDFKYLDENAPLQVEGEVVRIDTDAEHLIYQRTRVIISVSGTGAITDLELRHADQRVVVGETYSFLYLPNTRIAEVIENEP